MAKNVDNVVNMGSNTGDLKSFVERIENVQQDIDKINKAAKDECAPHADDIKQIKKDASDAGIARKELNAVISQRRKIAKALEVPAALNEEQVEVFNSYIGDLKDTPLGKFAFDMAAAA